MKLITAASIKVWNKTGGHLQNKSLTVEKQASDLLASPASYSASRSLITATALPPVSIGLTRARSLLCARSTKLTQNERKCRVVRGDVHPETQPSGKKAGKRSNPTWKRTEILKITENGTQWLPLTFELRVFTELGESEREGMNVYICANPHLYTHTHTHPWRPSVAPENIHCVNNKLS